MGLSEGHVPRDLFACQTSVWRTYFPHNGHPAIVVELTPDEEAFLTSDGIMATDVPLAVPGTEGETGDALASQPERCESPDAEESESGEADAFQGLANLKERVDAAVQALGGRVVPKANWSSPKDAVWISIDGLRCRCADDVLLLLKSSDRVAHDMDLLLRLRASDPLAGCRSPQACADASARAAAPGVAGGCCDAEVRVSGGEASTSVASGGGCDGGDDGAAVEGGGSSCGAAGAGDSGEAAAGGGGSGAAAGASGSGGGGVRASPPRQWPAELVLKKAFDLDPGREFRCFVAARRLVGVSQRDPTQHFPPLLDERAAIAAHISEFHSRVVLPSRFPLLDYTYDVYVTTKGVVRLVDFNPVGPPTQPLLFTWDELYPTAPAAPTTPRISDDLEARHPQEDVPPQRDAGGGEGVADACCLHACRRAGSDAGEAGEGGGCGGADDFELRVVEEASHLQAGSLAYGAPFDVVGMHGMAWDDVIEHMRQQARV